MTSLTEKSHGLPTGHLQTEHRQVNIAVPDGTMEAYLAQPTQTGTWPAVIVLMEIFGVNSYIREVADRIAAEGYVVLAPNYYHRTTPNLELGYTERDMVIGRKHKEATTRDGLLVDLRASIDYLKSLETVSSKEKMGCIGFCFGGHVAYIAAGMKEIAATASFYPGGVATSAPGGGAPTVSHSREIQGEILCLFGGKDSLISHEDTVTVEKALQQAGVKHEVVRYSQVGHGFFCHQRDDYDDAASADAWNRVKALFARHLK
jgi:carboxymethylenebutenolidase